MHTKDNEIYGEIYYTAGRYGYTAIDRTHANGTGTMDCMSGIKPKKLAEAFCDRIIEAQNRALTGLLSTSLFGESGNSEAIYLYATNESDIYAMWFRPALVRLKSFLDDDNKQAYAAIDIIRSVQTGFEAAAEKYKKEFAEECKFKNFTPLDMATCAHQWIEHYKGEYKVNKLAGYESHEA